MTHHKAANHLYGIVDMGSNGVRFSISDLSPPTARSLPTVFQSRVGISLYDAQYSTGGRGPIPQPIIGLVLEALRRFKATCADFGVPETNVKVLATEATRTAVNSEDYRRQIQDATGWEVEMLAKEMEGRIGAMGVASSFQEVEGLVMDLGGGSTQMTWMIAKDGSVKTSPSGSFSFPYGAAALTRKLKESESQGQSAIEQLAEEMKSNFSTAYRDLHIPESLSTKAEQEGGFTLYVSGGGFRGWGYLLMSESKISPYPIPIINGFRVSKEDFQSVNRIQSVVASKEDIFRVSKRRAAQVPAVAFLIDALGLAIPNIKEIRFCQGGVREGFLFDSLDMETRALDPLRSASAKYGKESAGEIAELLLAAIPKVDRAGQRAPACFAEPVVRALADLMYEQSNSPKESASLGGLYCPLTGVLASAHGVSHTHRALLALLLCQRWSGEVAPPHDSLQDRLRQILTRHEVWWCNYLGKVAALVGDVYPAGTIRQPRLRFNAEWASRLGKKGLKGGIRLTLFTREEDVMTSSGVLGDAIKEIEDVGKKKYLLEEGLQDFGHRVDVQLQTPL